MIRFIKKDNTRIRRVDTREELQRHFPIEYFIATSRML